VKHSVAHIINPFVASGDSDLIFAQPITFETMRKARELAKGVIEVELLAACFEEDAKIVPSYFQKTHFLKASVLDKSTFNSKIKLPLLKDILEKAINASTAEYIIYSNVDIALYPNFYLKINDWINHGFDAIIVNRKRIKPIYTKPEQIELMLKVPGKSHPGFDCFVFHRSIFEKMELEDICIGVPFIEITFSQNLFHLAKKYKLVKSGEHTFHLGMEIFKNRAPKEYYDYNKKEYKKAILKLDHHLGLGNLPFGNIWLPFRIIRWGLHPCIPIRLALKLVWKKWFH